MLIVQGGMMLEWFGSAYSAVTSWMTNRELRKRVTECENDRAKLRADFMEMQSDLKTYRDLTMIGSITIDRYGRINDASSEITSMTGYTLEGLLRLRLRDLLPGQIRNQHDIWMKELAEEKRPLRSTLVEGEFRHADGSAVPVIVKLMEFHSDSGKKYRADCRRR